MKRILVLLLTIISISSFGQSGWIKPNNSAGTIVNGISADSAMYGPTGCGAPTLYSKVLKKSTQYYDSCNKRFYLYDPKLAVWDTIRIGASSGSGSTNTSLGSGYKIAVDGTNDIKSLGQGWGVILDSSTSGQVGVKVDTSAGKVATKSDLTGYANVALSNLSSVAINTSLLTGTSASINLGSITKNWKNLYLSGTSSSTDGIIYRNGETFIHNYQASGTDGDNTFIGTGSGSYFNLSGSGINGSYNLGVGTVTLRANTTGSRNTAIGTYAMQNNTTGVNNTVVGQNALATNTTGYNNAVLGVRAAAFGTGHDQVGLGVDALSRGNNASFNVGIGTDALYNVWNGLYNVAVGDSTLWIDSTGFKNTAVGSRAGYYLGDTYPNFATRHDSLVTFLGADASRDSSISGDVAIINSTAIGYNSKVSASNQVVIGNDNVTTTLLKGTITASGVAVPTISSTNTFTNKRWTARVGSITSSATPTINTDNYDIYKLTSQTVDITSFTTNLSGTPVDGDILEIQVTGTAARAITWGASFVSTTVTLPTTTTSTATLTVIFQYYTTSSYSNNKWHCVNYY